LKRILIVLCLLAFSTFLFAEEEISYVKEFLKANMLINDGNLRDALPLLEKINKNIDDESVVIKLAELYISLGKKDDFIKLMNKSLKKRVLC